MHPTEWFTAPFGASAFDKDPQATRLTMELDVTSASILPLIQQMDRWVVQAVSDARLFESVSKEDVVPLMPADLRQIQYPPSAHKALNPRDECLQVVQGA